MAHRIGSGGIASEREGLAAAAAEIHLAARHAQYLMALEQYQRRSKLTPGYTITVENLDNARRQSESAAASYQQAIADRDTAALNLNRTEVRAPVNGFITTLNLAKGTYASQGKPVMALIDSEQKCLRTNMEFVQ
jgi:multidrug resistance efflux pump